MHVALPHLLCGQGVGPKGALVPTQPHKHICSHIKDVGRETLESHIKGAKCKGKDAGKNTAGNMDVPTAR